MPPSIEDVLGPESPLARRLAGYEHRQGQLDMASAVGEALETMRHLFVEAGTGTGKTLAYLVPAILSGRKIVVSTATHALQEQIIEKDVPLVREVLKEHGVDVEVAVMKGLSNYLCKRRLQERLRSGELVGTELARIERWALETQTGERAEMDFLEENATSWRDVQSGTDTRIGAGCKFYDECFVTRMRRNADAARIVVVNHHLFFADLALRTEKGGFGGAIPAYDAVIFDEAHQIESVATDFFGVRISSARLDALVRDARRGIMAAKILDSASMRIVDDVENAAAAFFRAWSSAGSRSGPPSSRRGGPSADDSKRLLTHADWTDARHDALQRLDTAADALSCLAEEHDEQEPMLVLARRAEDLRADLLKIQGSNREPKHWVPDEDEMPKDTSFDGGVTWIDVRERSVALGASPVDLGPLLRERLFDRVPSVICTSATLATAAHGGPSFHFAKSRLGAPRDASELVVPSPKIFPSPPTSNTRTHPPSAPPN